jgi:hypothetical protein
MKTKKTTIKSITVAALMAATATGMFAQNRPETQTTTSKACGCPDVATRPTASIYNAADLGKSKAVLVGSDVVFKPNAILSCDTIWTLDKTIFVDKGNSITIKPGAVIKGVDAATATAFSALVVQRGGKIFASGTKDCPIIFTSSADNLDGSYPLCNRGKWGGIVILGIAKNNLLCSSAVSNCTPVDEKHLGVVDGVGAIEGFAKSPRVYFGAGASDPQGFTTVDDNDNSGIFQYVSIRHAGEVYNGVAGNEVNGLTLGSVGRSTTIDHIEVIASDDDAIELFGGTVNLKYISAMFGADDMFDWDLGYSGKMQFLFGVQANQAVTPTADNGFESDTWDNGNTAAFLSQPQIYNVTLIGNGAVGTLPAGHDMTGKAAVRAKEGTQGLIQNSIFAGWNTGVDFGTGNTGAGFKAALAADAAFVPGTAGTVGVHSSVFFSNTALQNPTTPTLAATNTTPATLPASLMVGGTLNCATNTFDFPAGAKFDPIPTPQITTALPPNDGFFKNVNYKGAFSTTDEPWLSGWSIGAFYGLQSGLSGPTVCPTDTNYDGVTNVTDLNNVKLRYNQACPKP